MEIHVTPRRRRFWDVHLAPIIKIPLIVAFCVIILAISLKFGQWFFTQWFTQLGMMGC